VERGTALLTTAFAALLLSSCDPGEKLDPRVEKLGRATGPAAQAPREEPRKLHEGVVEERIHVPNYTYLHLGLADGREEWAAVPKTEIEVGARARVVESLVMREFVSPTLGRTFDSIVFGVLEGGAAAARDAGSDDEPPLPPGHPPI